MGVVPKLGTVKVINPILCSTHESIKNYSQKVVQLHKRIEIKKKLINVS